MDILATLLYTLAEGAFFYIFVFLFTFGVLIFIHELGHFLAARFCGVHIETFAVGFGKELFGFGGKEKMTTRWSICAIPLGGYVKLFGETDPDNPIVWDHENERERRLTEEELKHAYCTKTIWQRALIVFSGPLINILLAIFIFAGVFTFYGQLSQPLIINAVAQGSAAQEAGIQLGDQILEMDGRRVRRLEDIYDTTWIEEEPVTHEYTIKRNEEIISVSFSAKQIAYTTKKGIERAHGQTGMVRMRVIDFESLQAVNGIITTDDPDKARDVIRNNFDKDIIIEISIDEEMLGIPNIFKVNIPADLNEHLFDPEHIYYDRALLIAVDDHYFLPLSPIESFQQSLKIMQAIVTNTIDLLSVVYKGKTDEPVIGGVAKMAEHTANAAKSSIYDYLMFTAGFSFMIAILNLLPIPVLDGGYLMFLLYELVRGKPLSIKAQNRALIIGVAILGGIMIFANINDFISIMNDLVSQ